MNRKPAPPAPRKPRKPTVPPAPPGGRSATAIADVLHEVAGNVTVAAQRLGMSRGSLVERIAKSDFLRGAIEDEREKTVDLAETRLRNAIVRPEEKINMDAVKFALTSPRAASRGWGKPSSSAPSGETATSPAREDGPALTPEQQALAELGVGPDGR